MQLNCFRFVRLNIFNRKGSFISYGGGKILLALIDGGPNKQGG